MSFWRGDLSNLRDKDIEFLKTVSELSGLSMALWMTGRQLSDESWTSCRDSVHPCFTTEKLRSSLEGYCRGERPCIYLESDQIIYGIMPIGPSSLALGPAALWTPSEDQLQAYASWHELKDPIPIPKKDPDVIMRLMNLICLHFTDTSFPMEEIH
ncbi:MAG: hypothetical protein J6P39_06065, partial [Oscillospiraceae bacterium]|nr:hypothetical protein [Oscillospiraceae bacterium]